MSLFETWGACARWLLLGSALIVAEGCSGPTFATVQGRVTLDGKPVSDCVVMLFNDNGSSVAAPVATDGTYRIEKAELGHARFAVRPNEVGDDAARKMAIKEQKGETPKENAPKVVIPEKYTDMATSDIVIDVAAGENKYDVEMKN